jgi:membrane associated rhomboid family serine protease
MTRRPSNAIVVAGFWCLLAVWQAARGFARCEASSAWASVFWGLQLVGLVTPLLAVVRLARRRDERGEPGFDVPVAIAVLAYVPMLIAMRLLELCLTAG